MKFTILEDRIEIMEADDPAEVLKVKTIPGRFYSNGRWIVPIFPGLASFLETDFGFLGTVILAALDERETAIRKSVEPPPVTPYLMRSMRAADALARALAVQKVRKSWRSRI